MVAGDITLGNGRGGVSIYGSTFESENFDLNHEKPFLLTQWNDEDPKKNKSLFGITFAKTPILDGQHTVFGEVLDGIEVLKKISKAGTIDEDGKPTKKIIIVDSGVL